MTEEDTNELPMWGIIPIWMKGVKIEMTTDIRKWNWKTGCADLSV